MVGHKIAVAGIALLASLTLATQNASAYFTENFDSEVVGTTPSTWGYVGNNGNGNALVVTNASSESAPNSLEIAEPHNSGYEAAKFYTPVSFAVGNDLLFRYSLDVVNIPNGAADGNAGFTIGLDRGSFGGMTGDTPPATLRIFSVANDTSQYYLYGGSFILGPFPTNTFVDVLIQVTPTNATDGTVAFSANGGTPDVIAYTGNSGNPVNAIRIDSQGGTGADENITFRLDNVSIVPEPASFILLALGVMSIFSRRRRA